MEQLSLFDDRAAVGPLASRLRPTGLEEFVGQKHLLGEGKVLRRIIDQERPLWPGSSPTGQRPPSWIFPPLQAELRKLRK